MRLTTQTSKALCMVCSLFLSVPVLGKGAYPSHNDRVASWHKELAAVMEEQQTLDEEPAPALDGWLSQERQAFLGTNRQVEKLVLALRRELIEVKLALAESKTYQQFLQAWTWVGYFLSGAFAVISLGGLIFAIHYAKGLSKA